MEARPAVQRGMEVPEPSRLREIAKDPEKLKAYAEKSKQWVQAGMAADANKHGQ
jgi:glutathione S-transferase